MSAAVFYEAPKAGTSVTVIVVVFSLLAVCSGSLSALINLKDVGSASKSSTALEEEVKESTHLRGSNFSSGGIDAEFVDNVTEYLHGIRSGARVFVGSQFGVCCVLVFVASVLSIFAITSWSASDGWFAASCFVSFVVGSGAALLASALARHLALTFCGQCVFSAQRRGMLPLYKSVIRIGISSALVVGGVSLLVLYLLLLTFDVLHRPRLPQAPPSVNGGTFFYAHTNALSTFASAFALGSGLVVLFTRFGGGAFGASSAVAAAVEGTVMRELRKHDPRNPVSVAQLIGLVVGEVSGTGCDVVGTLGAVVAVSAALSSQCVLVGEEEARAVGTSGGWGFTCFNVAVLASGLLASAFAFVLTTHVAPPWLVHHLGKSLALQQVAFRICPCHALLPTDARPPPPPPSPPSCRWPLCSFFSRL